MSKEIFFTDNRNATEIERWKSRALTAESRASGLMDELAACRIGKNRWVSTFSTLALSTAEED